MLAVRVGTGSVGGVVLLVTLLAAVAVELSGGHALRRGAVTHDGASHLVLVLTLGPGIALLVSAHRILPGASIGLSGVCLAVGELILACGCALRLWSIRTLGSYFTRTVMVSPEQQVVSSGPYAFVRHPSYTALLLYALGAGVASDNWLGLVAVTALTFVGLRYRIHVEERALSDALGERYRAYAAAHRRLVPGLW